MKTNLNKTVTEAIFDYLKISNLGIKIINLEIDENQFIIDFYVSRNISENQLELISQKTLKLISKNEEKYYGHNYQGLKIKFLKIRGVSGIQTKNNELGNRIFGLYGTNEEDFKKELIEIKEKEQRDHRKIGADLELFYIDEMIGKGLPIWLPNGVTLKKIIQNFIYEQEEANDFIQVETPIIGSIELFKTSGHYDHYKESMFPNMKINHKETFILRPMACPMHVRIFQRKQRSYRELPIRFAEQVKQYRYEPSGSLLGLERVRAMELTDSHIFLREDQVIKELKMIYKMIALTLKKFAINIDYIELALHDPQDKQKYHGDSKMWIAAENSLKTFLKEEKIAYKEVVGEAAFYGPKIDIQIKTALGHQITVSTIQLDFYLPEKFDIKYIDQNNEKITPIMIHRGFIGTYERFISILLEQTKGNLPMWLAPQQAVIIPVNNKSHLDYCQKLYILLKENNVRVIIDDKNDRLSNKIRIHQIKKIKTQIIIGDDEVATNSFSVRNFGEKDTKKINTMAALLKIYK